jgi:hypothetical protein
MPDIDHEHQQNLPRFKRTRQQLEHVARHRATANLIRSLWKAASPSQRKDNDFLVLLVKLGWNNRSKGKGFESTQEWRNEQLAEYLGVQGAAGDYVAQRLGVEFPSFKKRAQHLIQQRTGMTHYYPASRPATLEFVRRHRQVIGAAFDEVSQGGTENRIGSVTEQILGLGRIKTPWGSTVSPLKGFTPAMACLDPRERFPVMNNPTRPLLRALGQTEDSDGAVALYSLIRSRGLGIKYSLELDVYAFTQMVKAP